MKPRSIYQIRPDGLHLICSACPDKKEGEDYCVDNEKSFSHGICSDCSRNPVPEGEVFPVKKVETVIPFRTAGFIQRHNIHTEADMEKFLNGEL